MSKKKDNHYVDDEKFTREVTAYAEAARDAIETGEDPEPMNNYIGKTLLDMATNISSRSNFVGYSYKSEMIADAIEDTIKYLKNFNPAKVQKGKKPSAYSYVSRIMWFAFLRRLKKEKKQHELKQLLIYNAGIIDEISHVQDHDNTVYENQYLQSLQSMAEDYYKMLPEDSDKDAEEKVDPKKPSEVRYLDPDTLEEI